MKIWLVDFPTYKYNEDVKDLARRNNLKVIDAKFSHEIDKEHVETSAPKLTLKKAATAKK